MKREWDLSEVTDGKKYGPNDMVKADCQDCAGCSACCHGMGDSIVLDPYDVCRLTLGTNQTMQELLAQSLELGVVDGVILPHLQMKGKDEACSYLDENGRCSIHPYRPGICRMFPLGRLYEDGDFSYILQIHECKKQNRSKIKVCKWLDTPNQKAYHKYICDWHELVGNLEAFAGDGSQEVAKQLNIEMLKLFYFRTYPSVETFYDAFYQRLEQWRNR